MNGFGERLKEARGSESQASFAKKLGITQVAYSRYEANAREPNLEALYQIGIISGVSIDWLLGLPGSKSTAVDFDRSPPSEAAPETAAVARVDGASIGRDCLDCPLLQAHLKRFSRPRK